MLKRCECVFAGLLVLMALLPTGVARAEADAGVHLFMLSGQSNMRGPLPQSFRSCVEAVFGKDKVLVVTVARPSQPIKMWHKGWQPPKGMTDDKPESNGKLYEGLMKAAKKRIGDKKLASVTFIWMQGEADAGKGWGGVYEKSFLAVVDQIKQDLGVKQVNFVLGRINDFWTDPKRFPDGKLVRSIQKKLGESHAHGDWVNTDDLNRGVNPWGGYSFEDGHFPPPGYVVMGQRFAHKACLLIDPKMKIDSVIFHERFFDEADAIKTHAAVGKPVTGSGNGLEALTDGRFAKADHKDSAWVGFDPAKGKFELVVDLGRQTPIDSIAINTLLSAQAKAQFPDKITYSTSADGKAYQVHNSRYNTIKFYNPKKLRAMRSKGIKPQAVLVLTAQRTRQGKPLARYIKIQIEPGKQWVYLDEVVVNPSSNPSSKPPAAPASPAAPAAAD